ncbi:MAG TPA: hypothetical protein VM935_05890 [Chitinophagaceae bacterium]|jgi:hypothetical protein|nr:hypothetical protein [Chitinophagaceae bacterium]
MSRAQPKKIDVYLTVNRSTIDDYFNPHDPAPIYKRQLRNDLIAYMSESVSTYSRNTSIRYKVSSNKEDKDLIEPFMHAVRRHYSLKEQLTKIEFHKFKKKSFKLLFMSLSVATICHGLLPLLFGESELGSTILHSVDVLCWVILYEPIHRLIFGWNPFLKEISLYHKLANSEILIMEYAAGALEISSKAKLRASA